MIPKVPSYFAFGWDLILLYVILVLFGKNGELNIIYSILWAAVFGIFGKMYIHENPEGDRGVGRMKNAVWIDLINMLLWFFTSIFAAVWFFFLRGGRSLHTGRANV